MDHTRDVGPGGRLGYSPRELAALTSLSERAVRYLLQTGRLGHVRIGRRVGPLRDAEAPIRPDAGHGAQPQPAQHDEAPYR